MLCPWCPVQGACAVVLGACFGGSAVSSFTAASNTALYSACIHGDGQVKMRNAININRTANRTAWWSGTSINRTSVVIIQNRGYDVDQLLLYKILTRGPRRQL